MKTVKTRRPARKGAMTCLPDFDAGVAALTEGRYKEAISIFSSRVLANPADLPSRTNRAIALWESCRWEEAIRALDDVVTDPRSKPDAEFHSLGHCYLNVGRYADAVDAYRRFFERVTRRHPLYWAALHCLAVATQNLGHASLAGDLMLQVVRLVPSEENYLALATLYWSDRRVPETLAVLHHAEDRGAASPELAALRVTVRRELGNRRRRDRETPADLGWERPILTGRQIAALCTAVLGQDALCAGPGPATKAKRAHATAKNRATATSSAITPRGAAKRPAGGTASKTTRSRPAKTSLAKKVN